MKKKSQRIFQITIVIVLIAFLSLKWINGKLAFYINMRFSPLTMLAILGLTMMAAAGIRGLRNQGNHKTHQAIDIDGDINVLPPATIIILAIPLLLGILVPERPLSTRALETRGMSLAVPASLNQNSTRMLEVAPDDRTVLDWIKIFNYETDITPYLQQPANVIGFVYHDPRLDDSQFMVGRFAITCCVADAFAIGMAVEWPNSTAFDENTWVNVKGQVDMITIEGRKIPLIHAEAVNPVAAPEEPYLYP